jgi:hypothetical protein
MYVMYVCIYIYRERERESVCVCVYIPGLRTATTTCFLTCSLACVGVWCAQVYKTFAHGYLQVLEAIDRVLQAGNALPTPDNVYTHLRTHRYMITTPK